MEKPTTFPLMQRSSLILSFLFLTSTLALSQDHSPCLNPEEFYHPDTQECINDCSHPSIATEEPYLICMRDTYQYQSLLLQEEDNTRLLSSQSDIYPFSPVRMIQYTRYLNVNFPPRLTYFLSKNISNVIPIRYTFGVPFYSQTIFMRNPMPAAFARYDFLPRFTYNFANDTITILITICFALTFLCLAKITKTANALSLTVIFNQLKTFCLCNFIIIILATSIDDVILSSLIELSTFRFGYPVESFSLAFNILVVITEVALLAVMIIYLYKFILFRRSGSLDKPIEKRQGLQHRPSICVIDTGFRRDSTITSYFYVIYTLRIAFPSFIATVLYSSPKAQAIIYLIMSVLIIGYILVTRPVVNKVNLIQLVIVEVLILLAHCCFLSLVVLGSKGLENSDLAVVAGDLAIGCNGCLSAVSIIFLIVKLVLEVQKLYKLHKAKYDIPIVAWLQIIVVYVQQGGMGFEEMLHEEGEHYVDLERNGVTNVVIIKGSTPYDTKFRKRSRQVTPIIVAANHDASQSWSPSDFSPDNSTSRAMVTKDLDTKYLSTLFEKMLEDSNFQYLAPGRKRRLPKQTSKPKNINNEDGHPVQAPQVKTYMIDPTIQVVIPVRHGELLYLPEELLDDKYYLPVKNPQYGKKSPERELDVSYLIDHLLSDPSVQFIVPTPGKYVTYDHPEILLQQPVSKQVLPSSIKDLLANPLLQLVIPVQKDLRFANNGPTANTRTQPKEHVKPAPLIIENSSVPKESSTPNEEETASREKQYFSSLFEKMLENPTFQYLAPGRKRRIRTKAKNSNHSDEDGHPILAHQVKGFMLDFSIQVVIPVRQGEPLYLPEELLDDRYFLPSDVPQYNARSQERELNVPYLVDHLLSDSSVKFIVPIPGHHVTDDHPEMLLKPAHVTEVIPSSIKDLLANPLLQLVIPLQKDQNLAKRGSY